MNKQGLYDRLPAWLQRIALNWYAYKIHRERYGPEFERVLAGLLESQWETPDDLRGMQEERLQRLIRHSYETVPYYRRSMEERKLTPGDIRTLEDLPKLPLLTRDIILREGSQLLSTKYSHEDLIHGHTSGTSGSPLSFYWDRGMCIFSNAVDWRQKLWAGLERSTWYGVLLGRKIVSLERRRPPFWQPNYLHKQLWLSSFHMSDETLDSYIEEMRRRRVQALEGYPSACYLMARHLVRKNKALPLRCVLTSSETLHSIQRETIERAFQCRVFDFYGQGERVVFATECNRHDGLHLNSEYGITEFVDEKGEGVSAGSHGYIVGTSLHNFGMPFIRYRTTDISRPRADSCGCGRGLPLMHAVTTKAEDVVITPEGRYIPPPALTHPFKPLRGVLKSQMVQTEPDQLLVKVVPMDDFDDGEMEKLVSALRERVGDEMKIRTELVDDIPPEPSGKFRWIISHVADRMEGLALWDGEEDSREGLSNETGS